MPHDGLRDQPDLSLFASDGEWGSFYPECLSDTAQGGTTCTPDNDAILLGGGGTSFSSPAMAGIQALIDQRIDVRVEWRGRVVGRIEREEPRDHRS